MAIGYVGALCLFFSHHRLGRLVIEPGRIDDPWQVATSKNQNHSFKKNELLRRRTLTYSSD
jgi:hypothetical protein